MQSSGSGAPKMVEKRASTSLAGMGSMLSVVELIKEVATAGVPGGYLEAGVWRGGMSIMAAAAMQVHGLKDRPIILADSFSGLPLSRQGSPRPTEGLLYHRFNKTLSVGLQDVLQNFDRFGVSRERVRPVPGYFVDSLPGLREEMTRRDENISLLRMDGDMYDSTADVRCGWEC